MRTTGTTQATNEPPPPVRGAGRTLRDALRGHPAGPEVAAALGPLADRAPPAGWDRWAPAERERYLDAVLDEARTAAEVRAAAGAAGAAGVSSGVSPATR
jgi:hypothetical protein